jgi:hypothetical protein
VSYQWTQLSGPAVKLSDASTAKLKLSQFTEEVGVVVLRLTVTDNGGATAYADKNVILNYKPMANAGPDVNVMLPTSYVVLYGSGTDIDGSIQGYRWRQKSGPKIKVSNDTNAALELSELVEGEYSFRFSVVDNNGVEHVDYATLIVEANANIASMDTFTQEEEVASLEMDGGEDKLNIASWDDKIVVVHNISGDILYHGKWSSETYQEVFNEEGLYLYQVLVGDARVSAGKIQITP